MADIQSKPSPDHRQPGASPNQRCNPALHISLPKRRPYPTSHQMALNRNNEAAGTQLWKPKSPSFAKVKTKSLSTPRMFLQCTISVSTLIVIRKVLRTLEDESAVYGFCRSPQFKLCNCFTSRFSESRFFWKYWTKSKCRFFKSKRFWIFLRHRCSPKWRLWEKKDLQQNTKGKILIHNVHSIRPQLRNCSHRMTRSVIHYYKCLSTGITSLSDPETDEQLYSKVKQAKENGAGRSQNIYIHIYIYLYGTRKQSF